MFKEEGNVTKYFEKWNEIFFLRTKLFVGPHDNVRALD
jgi:hypothetical protein